jgi:hypothetical protein
MITGALPRHYAAWLGSVWTRVASIFSTFVIVIVIKFTSIALGRFLSRELARRAVAPAFAHTGDAC